MDSIRKNKIIDAMIVEIIEVIKVIQLRAGIDDIVVAVGDTDNGGCNITVKIGDIPDFNVSFKTVINDF
ncbi:hypothetical protein Z042_08470 [Chania multitudinisentens RB-25]|uniref:Uncharacterized protein n=1 Tax=Chania multitudinisentens RB-25 TaxID=1441930 RepID=W0LJV8_9GAMM|nr:hypothetical protein [Chania multitudinisentens]AHG22719.1 hypothetical protein Z042_08470 [Chania multitudinisentens RB-25]